MDIALQQVSRACRAVSCDVSVSVTVLFCFSATDVSLSRALSDSRHLLAMQCEGEDGAGWY